MSFSLSVFQKWFEENEDKILSDFFSFLSFQSISTDEVYRSQCLKAADWIISYFKDLGWNAEALENSGLPVVFAEIKKNPSYPTVLIYHHYDVQPVDPIELWKTKPFEPSLKDGKIYARGASDNKGQCFLTLTALKALMEICNDLPLNIKLFIEGEEESGGAGTLESLKKYRDKLAADYLCVIDCDMPSKDSPAITLGYRGILALHLECTNSKTDLHSGAHGGIALNPNRILVDLFSKLWDEKGRVNVPHFYDGIEALSSDEKKWIDFSFDEVQYRKDFGVGALCYQESVTSKEANTIWPTLEINGMWGGYTGSGFKTVIPAKAYAKISCRLVPGQDPHEIVKNLEAFLINNTPQGAEIKIIYHHGAKAFRGKADSFLIRSVKKSMEEVFGKPPVCVLTGGAIPIVRDLMEATGADATLFGFALDTDDIHAPNEHFHWECFRKGFLTVARTLWEISQRKKA